MAGKATIVIVNVSQINGVVNVNLIVTVLVLVHVFNILAIVFVRMEGLGKSVKKVWFFKIIFIIFCRPRERRVVFILFLCCLDSSLHNFKIVDLA